MAQHTDTERAATSSNRRPSEFKEKGEDVRWHATSNLSDGTPIGRLGAYWYVLNEEGQAISDGYHEIVLNENGEYTGKRSARSEQIVLYTESD